MDKGNRAALGPIENAPSKSSWQEIGADRKFFQKSRAKANCVSSGDYYLFQIEYKYIFNYKIE